jgi:hypothetical protein
MAALLAAPFSFVTAEASTVSTVAGYDYYQGPSSQRTQGIVGAMGVDFGGAQASLAGVRYDDHLSGIGTSVIAGVGVPVHAEVTLRAQLTRFLGDEGYRAWRAKVGPQLRIGEARALIAYTRYQDAQDFSSNTASVESEIPLDAGWTGRLNTSYTVPSQGGHGIQGALGLGWAPIPHFELAGELGLAQQTAAVSSGPSQHLLPLLGGNDPSTAEQRFSPTALFSIRISAP